MAKWRNKVMIKDQITNEPNDNDVKVICEKLIPQLESILTRERNKSTQKIEEYFMDEFEQLIEEFKWIRESIEKGEDASEFSYDDWTEAFNNYLNELFDMGDMVTMDRGFANSEKFLWVG